MESVEMLMPANKLRSGMVLPAPGVEAYAAGSKEGRTKKGSEEAEKARARLMLKNLKLDEAEKMKAKKKDKTRKEVTQNLKPGAGPEMEPAGAGKKRKIKLVKHRMSQATMDILIKSPPVQPYRPSYSPDWRLREMQARHAAEIEAGLEARENIIKQYKEKGFAEVLFEVTDDEE